MPLHLTGALVDADSVRWRRMLDSDGAQDKMLVMTVPPDLFSKFPGLRSAQDGWSVDISVLPLVRNAVSGAHWLPRTGRFPARVATEAGGGYTITVQF